VAAAASNMSPRQMCNVKPTPAHIWKYAVAPDAIPDICNNRLFIRISFLRCCEIDEVGSL